MAVRSKKSGKPPSADEAGGASVMSVAEREELAALRKEREELLALRKEREELIALRSETASLRKNKRAISDDDIVEAHNFSNRPVTLFGKDRKMYRLGPGPEKHSDDPREYEPKQRVPRYCVTANPTIQALVGSGALQVREV